MPVDLPPALLWGLRRWLASPAATVTSLHRQPFSGGLSGSTLAYWRLNLRRAGIQSSMTLVHKRGAVVEGAFLRGAPQREVQVYAHLAGKAPIAMPTAVAFDLVSGDLWLLPLPPAKPTSHWLADWERADVENTLADLARLHAAYWQEAASTSATPSNPPIPEIRLPPAYWQEAASTPHEHSLADWPWLARPTTLDAPDLLADAVRSLQSLLTDAAFDETLTSERLTRLLALADSPTPLLETLNQSPFTLLHGDAGFQNIAISLDGRERVWYDWQLASAGPPALDLATYLHPWAYPDAQPPLSWDEMIGVYLAALARRGRVLDPDSFARQLDAALIWRWLCQWAPLLGHYRARLKDDVRRRLYHAFSQLHWPALARWGDAGQ